MSRYVLFATGPDHRQLARSGQRPSPDVRDDVTKAACSAAVRNLKGRIQALDLDSCWLGVRGLQVYRENLAEGRPTELPWSRDTGNIYLRSGWGRRPLHLSALQPLRKLHGHGIWPRLPVHFEGQAAHSGQRALQPGGQALRVKFRRPGPNVCAPSTGVPEPGKGFLELHRSYGGGIRNSCREKRGRCILRAGLQP